MTTRQPQSAVASASTSALEQALRRDRVAVIAAIIIIAIIAWAYTVYLAESGMGMGEMQMSMAMANMRSWGVADFGIMYVMWLVMMIAMMAPSAAPMLLMFASLNRRRQEQEAPYVPTVIFLAGYVLVWGAFSLAATAGNWGLHQASLLSSMMGASTSAYLGGALLLAAGVFQWTPLKFACLKQCRTPMGFPDDVVAGRPEGRAAHGAGPRRLLPGLLLGADVAALRSGRHEPGLDSRAGRLCACGKGGSLWRAGAVGQSHQRSTAGRLGNLDYYKRLAVGARLSALKQTGQPTGRTAKQSLLN